MGPGTLRLQLLDVAAARPDLTRDELVLAGREAWRKSGGGWYEPWSTFAHAYGIDGPEAMAMWQDFATEHDGPDVLEAWGAESRAARGDDAPTVWQVVRERDGFDYMDSHDNPAPRCPLGIVALDDALGGGIVAGTYTAVGGEAGTGKTALAIQSAYAAALDGTWLPILYSAEIGADEVWDRLLAIHTLRSKGRLKQVWWSGERGPDDGCREAFADFQARLGDRVAVRADVSSAEEIVGEVDELTRAGYRVFPIVDHLHILNPPDDRATEYEAISQMSGMLRELAKRCRVPMLVLAELRNIGPNEAKEPRLTWFRGSGKVGYDAGAALVLMRDGDRVGATTPTVAHIVKNRRGTAGTEVPLAFRGGLNWMQGRTG